jgi:hypothetical protein
MAPAQGSGRPFVSTKQFPLPALAAFKDPNVVHLLIFVAILVLVFAVALIGRICQGIHNFVEHEVRGKKTAAEIREESRRKQQARHEEERIRHQAAAREAVETRKRNEEQVRRRAESDAVRSAAKYARLVERGRELGL